MILYLDRNVVVGGAALAAQCSRMLMLHTGMIELEVKEGGRVSFLIKENIMAVQRKDILGRSSIRAMWVEPRNTKGSRMVGQSG